MKLLILLILISSAFTISVPVYAQIALTNHNLCDSSSGGCTTSGTNTSGSTLFVVIVGEGDGTSLGRTVTSSPSNTWNSLTAYGLASHKWLTIFYSYGPTTGVSQTFTCTSTNLTFVGCLVLTFSGTQTTSAVFDSGSDVGNALTSAGTSVTAGTITPSATNELLVSGWINSSSNAGLTVSGGLTVVDTDNGYGTNAYLVDSSTSPVTITWTAPNQFMVAAAAAFKPPPSISRHRASVIQAQ